MEPTRARAGKQIWAWWERLRTIRRRKDLSHGARWALAFLWVEANGRPERVRITAAELAVEFSSDRRTAQKWLHDLAAADAVEILDWDAADGICTLWIYDPEALIRDRPRRADPQGELFEDDFERPSPESNEEPATVPIAAAANQSTGPAGQSTQRAEEPARLPTPALANQSQTGPAGQSTSPGKECATNDAHSFPAFNAGADPAPPAANASPSMSESYARIAAGSPDVGDGASRAHAHQEPRKTQENNQLPNPRSKPRPTPSATIPHSAAEAELPRRFEAADTLGVLERAADRLRIDGQAGQRRIAAKVRDVVRDPQMGHWIPERLAWAVAMGHLPAKRLDNLLAYIADVRRQGKLKSSAGALLNAAGRRVASVYGFPWSPLGSSNQEEL